jgi:hypothetical protein
MGLFDLFRSAPKKQTAMDAVHSGVKAVLSTFVSERLSRYPDQKQAFESARAHLILGHRSCECTLQHLQETSSQSDMFGPLLEALATSPFRNLQVFFCTQQLVMINLFLAKNADFSHGPAALMAEGACDMYSQPFQFVEDVLGCVSQQPDADPKERFINCAHKIQASKLGIAEPFLPADRAVMNTVTGYYLGFLERTKGSHDHFVSSADLILSFC